MHHPSRGRAAFARAAVAILFLPVAAAACTSSATPTPSALGSPAASFPAASAPVASLAGGSPGASATPGSSVPAPSSAPAASVASSPAASGAVEGTTGSGDPAAGVRIGSPYRLSPVSGSAASKLADITKPAKTFLGATPVGIRQVAQSGAVKGVLLVANVPTSVASGSGALALVLTGLAGAGGAGVSSTTILGTGVSTLQTPAPLAGYSGFAGFVRGQIAYVVGAPTVAAAETLVAALLKANH